ncbi:putative HTH-type transcriptional regulator YhjB [Ruminiclostridium hungatei]|uniref:Putative HTH-type transcriptional regulator YhjB n=1 Tax=Ruminiclostridium hungatei TaxID=48256 RepID=A0A1V4SG00_RUMHU|nr:helix-turn-helix transcriptional regulator [Ruminiclostridium hungatei]OPX42197.1 putative HTH-type transcriptional regulator YhjB [Ruminiclostridium hungatei]
MDTIDSKALQARPGGSINAIHPYMPPNRLPADILKLLVKTNCDFLFNTLLFYNFILLLDEDFRLVSWHLNSEKMLSRVNFHTGACLGEERFGETSISKAQKSKAVSIQYCHESRNPVFSSFTNCTVPVSAGSTHCYISAFFLGSRMDKVSFDHFLLFTEYLAMNLKLYVNKIGASDFTYKIMQPDFNISCLSQCERNVLNLMKLGYSNKEISRCLHISENTTKSHIKVILDKLSCKNRTHVAVNAVLSDILALIE